MATESFSTWIFEENLKPFLTVLGWLVEYGFDNMDWDAIHPAVRKTSVDDDIWFDYIFIGSKTAEFKIAHADGCCIYEIDLQIPSEIKDRLQLAVSMLIEFKMETKW